MAHYAYIDKQTNTVVNVIHGKDETELIDGLDTETYYAKGTPYLVKRTSYNSKIRGTYAGIGYTYDPVEDIFITPQPYPSWIRSGSFWNPPIPYPVTDSKDVSYYWDESTLSWIENESLAK
jgi:hypothetical protein